MSDNINKLLANSLNQRIAQYLILNKSGTVNDIATDLSDIPRSSIYRHIKDMSEAGLLKVTSKKAVRGAVEKTYSLAPKPLGEKPSNQEIEHLIRAQILAVAEDFAKYFKHKNIEPEKDMLSCSRCTLELSDAEFKEMLQKIGEVYSKYINNKPKEGRKPRNITFISSPVCSPKDNEKGE